MNLSIQIASDLHIEFWEKKDKFHFLKPVAPILALLGDTCCVGNDTDFKLFQRFIDEVLPLYENIIIVPGNHEYYYNKEARNSTPNQNNTMTACDKKLTEYCRTNKKLHYLNNKTLPLQFGGRKYLLIGSALWSFIPESAEHRIQSNMNDYSHIYENIDGKIQNISPSLIRDKFLKNKKYIKSQLSKAKKNGQYAIILTHHKPYLSENYNPDGLDPAYESDLKSMFKDPVYAWCYGHTHIKDNSVINGVKLISNPKGYPYQRTGFESGFKLDL
jgi:predicted MPP superfamily phosphohydrolase